MAPRKRRKRAPAEKIVAAEDPIAQVVLDVQATHLGQTFDYLVEERWSQAARPGVMVRVRFGGRLLNGVIWKRTAASATPRSALRFLERVISPHVLVSESMRDDITRIADAYGGTRANILRLAVPPRVARIDGEQQLAARSLWVGRLRFSHVSDELMQRCFDTIQASYDGAAMLRSSLEGSSFAALVMDARPGARAWARDAAWMIAAAMRQNRAAVVVLPGIRQCEDLAVAWRDWDCPVSRRAAPSTADTPVTSSCWPQDCRRRNGTVPIWRRRPVRSGASSDCVPPCMLRSRGRPCS